MTHGFHDQLREALSDGITPLRLPAVLGLCGQEEPEIEMRFFEVSLSQQIQSLHDDRSDRGGSDRAAAAAGAQAFPSGGVVALRLVMCDPQGM